MVLRDCDGNWSPKMLEKHHLLRFVFGFSELAAVIHGHVRELFVRDAHEPDFALRREFPPDSAQDGCGVLARVAVARIDRKLEPEKPLGQ